MLNFFKALGIGILCVIMFVAGLFFNAQFLADSDKKAFSFTQELQSANKLMPDTFISNPKFLASQYLSTKADLSIQEKALIAKTFNEILERVARDKLCRGGSYAIEPTFLHKDGIEMPKGQRVRANLSCKIKADELEKYNTLLNDIDNIATKSGFIIMSLPALRAGFSNELIKENEIKLREELIKTALDTAKHYAELTNRQCELKKLDFSSSVAYVNAAAGDLAIESGSAFKNALPVVSEEEKAINALATYVCR